MIYERNLRHFRKNYDDKGARASQVTRSYDTYPVCATVTGCFCCSKKYKGHPDITQKLGLGVSLYLKQLKSLTILFLILSVLSLPAFILFFQGNEGQHSAALHDSKQFFSMFTLGNLGQSQSTCSTAN